MSKQQVKEILDRVQTWPEERQADVVEVLKLMEAQDKSGLRLTDEQAAEVRRRRAEKNPKTMTLAEFNERAVAMGYESATGGPIPRRTWWWCSWRRRRVRSGGTIAR